MREILFRGKRIDNGGWYDGGCAGDWVYGGYAFDGTNSYIVSYGVVVHECMGDAPDIYNDFSYIKVDPSTVGQYTGLTDKNDKRIFEGDIVSRVLYIGMGCGEARGVVVYRAPEFLVDCKHNRVMGFAQYPPENRDYEVIGNATDNPELMEAE